MKNSATKALEERLNNIDYSSLYTNYVPSKFALKFITFIKLVNGVSGEENKSPIFHYDMLDQIQSKRQNLFVSFRGSSKALALDTPIMTPIGNMPIKDLEIGDQVFDRNGDITKITNTSKVFNNKTYTIKLSDGSEFIANEDHIHIVQSRTINVIKGKKTNLFKEHYLTTKEIIAKKIHYTRPKTERNPTGKEVKWWIPLINKPIKYQYKSVPIHPYTVGVILGDGNIDKNSGTVSITSHIDDINEINHLCNSYFNCLHHLLLLY